MDPTMGNWAGKGFFCAWSGGKDCSYAIYKAMQLGGIPKALLTMCSEDGMRSRTHNLPIHVIQAQADALGVELVTQPCTWKTYETDFRSAVKKLSARGIHAGLTGDTEFGKTWLKTICRDFGMEAWLPLWEVDAVTTFRDLLDLGFKALVVAASDSKVGRELAGRTLDLDMVAELQSKHVDVLGEYNEYHTFVTDGPIFKRPVKVQLGELHLVNGYWIQDLQTQGAFNGF